ALLLLAALVVRAALPDRTFTHGVETEGMLIAWIDQDAHTGRPAEGTQEARQLARVVEELDGAAIVAVMSGLPGGMTRSAWPGVTNGNAVERRGARTHYVSAN